MEQNLSVSLKPERIKFVENCIKIQDFCSGKYKIPYDEIVYAYVCTHNKDSQTSYEPELTEITDDMDGDLVLYDSQQCKWRIRTENAGQTAGSMLLKLARCAPYILLGGQSWFDTDNEEDFIEITDMVDKMRRS